MKIMIKFFALDLNIVETIRNQKTYDEKRTVGYGAVCFAEFER